MFDILLTTYEFISGLGYLAYTVLNALEAGIGFLYRAIPFATQFIASFSDAPIFTAFLSLSLGLGVIKFLWKGA